MLKIRTWPQFLRRTSSLLLVTTLLSFFLFVQATQPPVCKAQGNCPEPAAYGRQPYPTELVDIFDRAGTNRLDTEAPDLPEIWKGYPPAEAEPIPPYAPCILLKAIGYTESAGWKQFEADYGQYGYTVISSDCGYGIMQITSGMEGGAGFDPSRVAAEPAYNIGTGARILIQKWNSLDVYIGNNNPYIVEDWYYAVWAYNGWGWVNNPNRNCPDSNPDCGYAFNPFRPPFDGTQPRSWYPYQEIIWGYAGHPPGSEFWQAVPLTLPPRESITNPPPTHIDTPQPSHTSCSVTYLSDVRINSNNWNSMIVVRNNSDDTIAYANVRFYDENGGLRDTKTNSTLAANEVWEVPLTWVSSFTRSAVVEASQDMAVVVENLKSGEVTNYQGITPSGSLGNAGWGQAGQPIYVPIFKHAWYGRSGDLYVQNVGNAPATVDLTLYQSLPEDNAGAPFHDSTWQRTIPARGQTIYRASQLGIPTDRVYSALLTSDQPLAVITVEHQSDGTGQASANGFSSGATTGYVPLVKKNWWGHNTGTSVQNLNGYTYTRVNYYEEDDTPDPDDPSTSWQGLQAYTTRVYYSPNTIPVTTFLGSAVVNISSSPAAVLVHEAGNGMYMMHNGFLAGTNTVILPRIYKNYGADNWTTGIQVQNVGGAPANVTIQYYDQNGNPAATDGDSIASNRAQVFWQGDASDPLPSPFVGSAVITSDQPIVAQVNVARDGAGDTGMSYSGFNR